MSPIFDEPKFSLHFTTIGTLLELIEAANSPMSSHEGGGGTNVHDAMTELTTKDTLTGPGRQNARHIVNCSVTALEVCEKELRRVYDNTKLHEKGAMPAQRIGGKDVSVEEGLSAYVSGEQQKQERMDTRVALYNLNGETA